MEALFRSYGIYAHLGQLYEPIDSHLLMRYEERKNGQILEEGITEAGAMASFIAAGTAYATHGVNTIPFFLYYSMFGFQRIGDSIWAAADMRCRGFLCGATAGRTTLNGEGLQHQDGHSHMHASTVPNVVAYDCAYAYELAIVVREGLRRMHEVGEDLIYYLTIYNETYRQPKYPGDKVRDGILKGLYKASEAEKPGKSPRCHIFGSGPLINEALRAQALLLEKFGVAADVWSATSYNELYRDAQSCRRWNRLHPGEKPRVPHITQCLTSEPWPVITTGDYIAALAERLAPFTPAGMYPLGTEGFGRSETRANLRRHFEIDAEHIALAALTELAQRGQFDAAKLPEALKTLGIDPDKPEPARA
jgi:pyruvate dehydrogenase E1 component